MPLKTEGFLIENTYGITWSLQKAEQVQEWWDHGMIFIFFVFLNFPQFFTMSTK